MKKLFYFMSLVAMTAAMAACGSNPDPEPESEPVEPNKISLAEAFQQFYMQKDETIQLTYTLSPSGVNVPYTLVWKSDNEDVATVDKDGNVTALTTGEVTISVSIEEYPDVKTVKSEITVLEPIKVADFLYSDGSWGSQKVVTGKEIIALVYWVGNPTLFDPILDADYPNCTHGLAMSLKQGKVGSWQKDFAKYYFGETGEMNYEDLVNSAMCDKKGSLTEWGLNYSSYADLVRPYAENPDYNTGNYCGLGGYTYTAILEEYTKTAPEAAQYPFEFYNNAMDLVKDIETPLTTSRWYVPSLFEAALMVNTALTKPSDFNNTSNGDDGNPLIKHNSYNVGILNSVLNSTTGADPLPTGDDWAIGSASDAYLPFDLLVPYMQCSDYWECLAVTQDSIGYYKESDEAKKTEMLKHEESWYNWLKENAGDNYANYEKYKTQRERVEIYLAIKGYEDDVTFEKLGASAILTGFSLFGILTYANVGVGDGLMHNTVFVYDGKPISGSKGSDNPYDVIRPIIAF